MRTIHIVAKVPDDCGDLDKVAQFAIDAVSLWACQLSPDDRLFNSRAIYNITRRAQADSAATEERRAGYIEEPILPSIHLNMHGDPPPAPAPPKKKKRAKKRKR